MSARPRLRVHPHREGPWLVVHGGRRFAVPPGLGRRLLDLDGGRPGVAQVAARLDGDRAAARALLGGGGRARRGRRGPWLRLPLVPAAATARAASRLASLTGWPGLATLAAGGALLAWRSGAAAQPAAGGGWPAWLGALALFAAGGLLHELGHSAALARAGYPPGGIGAGLMGVLPVLWCDVSAVALLGRRDRARVDLAGPALQVAAAGALAGAGALLPGAAGAACRAAGAGSLLAAAWSLTPVFRADGFWLLTDLLGVDDLDRLPGPAEPVGAAAARVAYRLVHAAAFGAMAAAALARGGRVAPAIGALLALLVAVRLAGLVRWAARRVRPPAPADPIGS